MADARAYEFIIVIPVADRPRMLANCIDSLFIHLSAHGCAGNPRVIVADDSADRSSITAHEGLVASAQARGLDARRFGLREQGELIRGLSSGERFSLSRIIGAVGADGFAPPRKGASITRNLASLSILDELAGAGADAEKTLVWFVDSDEEFSDGVLPPGGFLNYFHEIERIFADPAIKVLTGKVVGDPPVSPSVMVNTMLDDLAGFLDRCASASPEYSCPFHERSAAGGASAEYNDMADMFGYRRASAPVQYVCRMDGDHGARAAFAALSGEINGFFNGLHPTRGISPSVRTGEIMAIPARPAPARTVYTGNYVVRASSLRYFIPFANLGLRMAGPVLGRILRACEGGGFVSAELPLMHRRTLDCGRNAEYRRGVVEREDGGIACLSGELRNQFWGDVMLFTVERLAESGFPSIQPDAETLRRTIIETRDRVWSAYEERHSRAAGLVEAIGVKLDDPEAWWNRDESLARQVTRFREFLCGVERNFTPGSQGRLALEKSVASDDMPVAIASAIEGYPADMAAWEGVMAEKAKTALQLLIR
ncbi:MAG: glycosyltransferase [Nitrospirae bacterium]|nr:glycosyltransferase [Nitrospirota bacterium]